MLDWAIFQALNHFIPAAYMPPIMIILSAFLAFEQWLASTKRIKANSTLQLIVGFVQYFVGKEKENGSTVVGPRKPTQTIRPESKRGSEVTGGSGVSKPSGESGSAGSGNEYMPDWVKGTGGSGGPAGK